MVLVTVLHQSPSIAVLDYRCDAKPDDPSYDEHHTRYSVSYVRRGSFGYRTRGRAYELVPGATLLGRAGDDFRCSHDHHIAGDECLSFQFSEEFAETFGGSAKSWWSGAVPPVSALMALGELASHTASPRCALGLDELAMYFSARLFACVSGQLEGPVRVHERDRKRAVDAALLIEARSTEALNVEHVAATIGLSPFHFLRTFRAVLGVTPHQYLIRCRLRRAASLLTTDLGITEIAYEVGFGDLSNFVRTFHRACGASPRAFRRAARGDRKIFQERLRRLS
ncbi:MAG TPA: AraC family transcriptional regulator [Polyangiaceae bacterium]|nr:AraC family transcriptional regulator [Polyangiaceae bacterium]